MAKATNTATPATNFAVLQALMSKAPSNRTTSLTDIVVDNEGHEQVFAAVDPATGVQLSFISRTGHRVPMTSHNVSAMFEAISNADSTDLEA